jgi:FtsP/CotA-like multicopper oxidase with cupredoxin domain
MQYLISDFRKLLCTAILTIIFTQIMQAQKTVRYDLYVRDTIVRYTSNTRRAIAVNGQIPMPTLVFTEGDTAEIFVHNQMNESTSLHWHGLMLPNKEDGVPNLTQMPIKPHTTHVYKFPIIQNGTHWYHSHTGLQEQIGMYGSLVMLKKNNNLTFRKGIDDLPTEPIILSEWTDYRPENVHRMLHNATDWFAIQKNATQSYAEAITAKHFSTKVKNEWKRMLAMDVSDVYYDKILINGKSDVDITQVDGKALNIGDQIRLRGLTQNMGVCRSRDINCGYFTESRITYFLARQLLFLQLPISYEKPIILFFL